MIPNISCTSTGDNPSEDSCKVWAELADKLEPYVYNDRCDIGVGCNSEIGQTGTVSARWQAHQRFKQKIAARLEAHFGKLAAHQVKQIALLCADWAVAGRAIGAMLRLANYRLADLS